MTSRTYLSLCIEFEKAESFDAPNAFACKSPNSPLPGSDDDRIRGFDAEALNCFGHVIHSPALEFDNPRLAVTVGAFRTIEETEARLCTVVVARKLRCRCNSRRGLDMQIRCSGDDEEDDEKYSSDAAADSGRHVLLLFLLFLLLLSLLSLLMLKRSCLAHDVYACVFLRVSQ